ncbi:MAG: DNA-3-methyladenine glycosylase 2 family protein [Flavobacteriales bacterium]|nr:DNA-3-methyladenine glycosylase 2 family protein [Flavobacteriales bacterium]
MKKEEILNHLSTADPVMKQLIRDHGPYTLKPKEPYHSLLGAIVSQQLSTKAADTIWKRMMDVINHDMNPQNILRYSPDQLRAAGLSNAKASWVLDLSKRVHEGMVDFHAMKNMDDETVKKNLIELKGIGSWTADMFLMFSLNRMDILPVGDVGIQRAIREQYGFKSGPSERTMNRISSPWKPYRTIGCWYLWRSLES